ncbi:IpaD/SipD/SspD family type III secretion system needle tip protein [Proteus vulgaris]|uniref:IpaD/SipD/SspD family type III secretion system needle tip protein n=1 Tax=Proteus vulgaris TaxID=585 RepID=UPI0006594A3D|nr:IpaD/SipD/SspD family type III secretion system needle tip protein [Proteus vulgaris]CRL61781.1 Cell invasion protein SipD [Proteus vulgaris]
MATAIDVNNYHVDHNISLNLYSNPIPHDEEVENFLNNIYYSLEDIKKESKNINNSYYEENKFTEKQRSYINDNMYVQSKMIEKKALNDLNTLSRSLHDNALKKEYSTDSLFDLFNDVKQSIVAGKNDYLDVLKDIFAKYMEFVKELREILALLSDAVKAGSKDGYINIDINDLLNNLLTLKSKFGGNFFNLSMSFTKDAQAHYHRDIKGEQIYYENNHNVDNAAEALEKLLNEIKGVKSEKKDNSIPPDISFGFSASIDVSSLDKLIDYLMKMDSFPHDILQTEFDLLKKTLDAFEKNINTNLDELSKKYSSANSNYDNFVKIVSSTMNTLLEMAKGFLRF